MSIEELKAHIGQFVMSNDAGTKMIRSVRNPHGPYKLVGVTKGGMAILDGHPQGQIAPSLLIKAVELPEKT
jgi:hypothetical protein